MTRHKNPDFRLMATRETPEAIIYNLEVRLSSIQDFFRFNVDPELVAVPRTSRRGLRSLELEKLALDLCRQRYDGEIPILITSSKMDDGIFSSFDNKVAVISVRRWSQATFSPWPVERFLLYTIADILMNRYVDTPVHETKRCCIGDYCNNERDVNACLETCDYCSECNDLISSALQKGKIIPDALGAIHRILDSASGRRRAFVLMPFSRKFHDIYLCIKRTAEESGWQCIRADDIVHTRDILTVVFEEIERATLIISDLTGQNANVFYELGYAHAIGKNTVLLTRNRQELPFDLRQRITIEYRSTPNKLRVLSEELRHHFSY